MRNMGWGPHMAGGALRGGAIGSRAEGVVIEGDGVIVRVLRLQQLLQEVLRPLHMAAGRLSGRRSALAPAYSTPRYWDLPSVNLGPISHCGRHALGCTFSEKSKRYMPQALTGRYLSQLGRVQDPQARHSLQAFLSWPIGRSSAGKVWQARQQTRCL